MTRGQTAERFGGPPNLEPTAGLFKLLSDGTRLGILLLLSSGERNVGSLCNELGLPQPVVSHHRKLLRAKRFINDRRDGRQVFYGLHDQLQSATTAGRLNISGECCRVEIRPTRGLNL